MLFGMLWFNFTLDIISFGISLILLHGNVLCISKGDIEP